MHGFDWPGLLTRWNSDLLRCPRVVAQVPPSALASRWLGYPGATEEEIHEAEFRLGVTLPPSYRAFLRFSNGWRTLGTEAGELFSTSEVDWFSAHHRDAIEDWLEGQRLGGGPVSIPDEEYFVYGDAQKQYNARYEYLTTALQVSAMKESSVYLLNPRVILDEGEWEAWFIAPWIPGAWRYRSFWDMMEAEYDMFTC